MSAENGTGTGIMDVVIPDSVSASAGPVAVVGNRAERRMQKRIERLDLDGFYKGYHVTAWINFPGSIREEMRSGEVATVNNALGQVVLEHDLVDFDGNPYPPADDPEFWKQVPDDLQFVILATIRAQFGKLPNANART